MTYRQPSLCSTTTPDDSGAPLGTCAQAPTPGQRHIRCYSCATTFCLSYHMQLRSIELHVGGWWCTDCEHQCTSTPRKAKPNTTRRLQWYSGDVWRQHGNAASTGFAQRQRAAHRWQLLGRPRGGGGVAAECSALGEGTPQQVLRPILHAVLARAALGAPERLLHV